MLCDDLEGWSLRLVPRVAMNLFGHPSRWVILDEPKRSLRHPSLPSRDHHMNPCHVR